MVGVHVDVDGMGGLVQLLSCSRSGLSEVRPPQLGLQGVEASTDSTAGLQWTWAGCVGLIKFVQAINKPK